MKKTIFTLILLLATLGLQAQDWRWEHNIHVGSGLLIDNQDGNLKRGFTAKVGYGIRYRLNSGWSLMPGVAYRTACTNLFNSKEGSDDDAFQYIDVPLTVQFHPDRHWVLGLAPVLSFCIDHDEWYIDANPNDPLNGRSKIKPFSLGLQPSITYQWRRMSLGVEATVGLLNDGLHHGLRPGYKRRLSNVMALLGVRF